MILDRLLDLAMTLDEQRDAFTFPTWGYLTMALAVMQLPEEEKRRILAEIEEVGDTMIGHQLASLTARVSLKLADLLVVPQVVQLVAEEEEKPKRKRRKSVTPSKPAIVSREVQNDS